MSVGVSQDPRRPASCLGDSPGTAVEMHNSEQMILITAHVPPLIAWFFRRLREKLQKCGRRPLLATRWQFCNCFVVHPSAASVALEHTASQIRIVDDVDRPALAAH